MFEWDEAKRRANLAKHGVDFADVARFDFPEALIIPDRRSDYGEERYIAIGYIARRLHVVVYTQRRANRPIISARKANRRERRFYAEHIQDG